MIKLAVIGDPIAHSLSPTVHGAVLRYLDIPFSYETCRVQRGGLEEFLSYAEKTGLTGFNLTMPHKVDILPYLDAVEGTAERLQSVNTVRLEHGKRIGYNTDGGGYVQGLKQAGESFAQKRVMLLGAGGVARTLAAEAAAEGAKKIVIHNRSTEKADAVAEFASAFGKCAIESRPWSPEELRLSASGCDLLIQATPLGMEGIDADYTDLSFLEALPEGATVTDLIYRPEKTRLLKQAEQSGKKILNGLPMLIFQAILADEIYLNKELPKEELFHAAKKAILL